MCPAGRRRLGTLYRLLTSCTLSKTSHYRSTISVLRWYKPLYHLLHQENDLNNVRIHCQLHVCNQIIRHGRAGRQAGIDHLKILPSKSYRKCAKYDEFLLVIYHCLQIFRIAHKGWLKKNWSKVVTAELPSLLKYNETYPAFSSVYLCLYIERMSRRN